jgi:hypothetical protein
MELQTTITIISVLTGAITIITYIRKNENRITILEGKVNDKLDIIVKELDVLKSTKEDKQIVSLELKFINEKLNNVDKKLDEILRK